MKPISEVKNEAIVSMWKEVEPDYKLPTRKTMSKKIRDTCESVVNKLKDIISNSETCAAQCDIWSSRKMHGYFGLCLSVINDGSMTTRLVACRRFCGPHTAANISSMYSTLVREF
jgi:hypothetical protein